MCVKLPGDPTTGLGLGPGKPKQHIHLKNKSQVLQGDSSTNVIIAKESILSSSRTVRMIYINYLLGLHPLSMAFCSTGEKTKHY